MKIVVLKFGGTSVGNIKKIKRVAKIIIDYKKKNYMVIVISSAMSGVTNELIKKSFEISDGFSESEKLLLISKDFFINSFVTPLIADETTITL